MRDGVRTTMRGGPPAAHLGRRRRDEHGFGFRAVGGAGASGGTGASTGTGFRVVLFHAAAFAAWDKLAVALQHGVRLFLGELDALREGVGDVNVKVKGRTEGNKAALRRRTSGLSKNGKPCICRSALVAAATSLKTIHAWPRSAFVFRTT